MITKLRQDKEGEEGGRERKSRFEVTLDKDGAGGGWMSVNASVNIINQS